MKLYTLENNNLRLTFLTTGASIYAFEVKALNNRNVVLSTKDLAMYKSAANAYFGATVGPVAGRLKEGKFSIDGKLYKTEQNEKITNTLHGGYSSFAFCEFSVIVESSSQIVFEYTSDEDAGGFPGLLTIRVIYTLEDDGLEVKYIASGTKDTIINITNHSYFNLDGHGHILDHEVNMDASGVYELDDKQINIRRLKLKANHPLNFKKGKKLRDIILHPEVNLLPTMGIDHLFVVNDGHLSFETKDLRLKVAADYPGYQLYSTNFPPEVELVDGTAVNLYHALAIEPVDLVTSEDYEYKNLILRKDEVYEKTIKYTIELL